MTTAGRSRRTRAALPRSPSTPPPSSKAFALGGGTYTGIEAVSNNVHMLKEPRVRTGRWTMLYMALSLAFTAGGLILLYLVWSVMPEHGRTLNAVTRRRGTTR